MATTQKPEERLVQLLEYLLQIPSDAKNQDLPNQDLPKQDLQKQDVPKPVFRSPTYLSRDEVRGNVLKARTDIKAGDLVLIETPVVFSPVLITFRDPKQNLSFSASVCGCCHIPIRLTITNPLICEGCSSISYCSDTCLQKDAPLHQKICNPIVLKNNNGLISRLLALGFRFPSSFKPSPVYPAEDILLAISMFQAHFGKDMDAKFIEETIRIAYSVVFTAKTFITKRAYGYGIYHTASYINHSCDPSAYYYMVGTKMFLRAARDISYNEEITICYNEDCIFEPFSIRNIKFACIFEQPKAKEDLEGDDLRPTCFCERCASVEKRQIEATKMRELKVKSLPPKVQAVYERVLWSLPIDQIFEFEADKLNTFFGDCHVLRSRIYLKFTADLFEKHLYEEIEDFPVNGEKFLDSLRKNKILTSTSQQMIWFRVYRFLLLSLNYHSDSIELLNHQQPDTTDKPNSKDGSNPTDSAKQTNGKKGKKKKAKNTTKKPKKKKTVVTEINPREGILIQAYINMKHVMEKWLDWGAMDMDYCIFPTMKLHIEEFKNSKWEGNVKPPKEIS